MRSYAEVMMKENDEENGRVIGVKVSYGEEIRRASFSGTSFSFLRSLCANLFSLYDGKLIGLKYKDCDGDLITMSSDSDLVEAIKQGEPLHLFVTASAPAASAPAASAPAASAPAASAPAASAPAASAPLAPAPADANNAQQARKTRSEAFRAAHKELSAAKEAADPVAIKKCKEKLQEIRQESQADEGDAAAKQKKHELRAAFNRERQELRDALTAAKEKGDKPTINECKAKLHDLRDRNKAPTFSPVVDPAPTPASAPMPATTPVSALATNPASAKDAAKKEKQELREEFVREKRALKQAIVAAKEKRDKQAVKESKTMIQVLRQRFDDKVAALSSPAKSSSEPLSASPSPAPAQGALTAAKDDARNAAQQEWKEKQAAFWKDRKEVRDILIEAKKKGDKQTVNMCQAKLKALQEKKEANNAARAERKAACVARKQQGKELREELNAARTAGDKQAIIAAKAKIAAFRGIRSDKPEEGSQAPIKREAKNADLKWKFVRDVTTENGSKLPANSQVVKTWQLSNNGSVGWPKGSQPILLGIRQDQALVKTEQAGTILPNEEVEVSATFVTPTAPGSYVAHFRMSTPAGVKFGKKMATTFTI